MAQEIARDCLSLCSGCAAVDFPAFFIQAGKIIEIEPTCTLESRKCDLCTFASSCFRARGLPHVVGPGKPFGLSNQALDPDERIYPGIIRHGFPSGSLEDGFSYCELGSKEKPRYLEVAILLHLPSRSMLLENTISPKIDWGPVKAWVRASTIRPTPERTSSGESSPLLVIDCSTRTIVLIDETKEYVTLSYVWGAAPATSSGETEVNAALAQLPPTVEDSLIVCLELGHRYLWVDRYCIPQDDQAQRHLLIQRMDTIYANSVVTIVACAGSDPQHGLPGVTRPRQGLPRLHLGGSGYLQMIPSARDIERSTWTRRAWTYQETLLSQRRLYFTDSQVYLESPENVSCEWLNLLGRKVNNIGEFDWLYAYKTWLSKPSDVYRSIREYTRRTLSFESDALNAFLGILAAYERRFQVYHLWGMPYLKLGHAAFDLPALTQSLFFKLSNESVRRIDFPSWSWTGWTHFVTWHGASQDNMELDWYMDSEIAVELKSGDILSLHEYSSDHDFSAKSIEELSHFIHIQGYLVAIHGLERGDDDSDMKFDLANEIYLSYRQTPWELCLPEGIIGQSLEGYALWRPSLLTGDFIRWSVPHILLRNMGEYWERVSSLALQARYKDSDGQYIKRESWPGDLQTIRLG